MKIAVPTRGKLVDNHFGHCEMYTVFTVDESNTISSSEILPSPQGCGCKSDIAEVLEKTGVKIMLAGGIGEGAINVLSNHGISVVRGCAGDVKTLVERYLSGKLTDSGVSCTHHEHQHEEGHTCQH